MAQSRQKGKSIFQIFASHGFGLGKQGTPAREKVGGDRLMQCEGRPRAKFQAKECRYRILLLCILFHCTFYKFLAESNYCPLLSPT
jgi:hypothetical protein